MKTVVLRPSDPEYPTDFQKLADPPKEIHYLGSPWSKYMNQPRIVVVGSRKCSPYGHSVINSLVRDLSPYNPVIISGLALGADSIAHRAALDHGLDTIAVIASIDQIYPSSHRQLAREILMAGGSLLSEYSGTHPTLKYRFIGRNRLIAALGDAVLIPEAAINSGSLHTASFALDIGIPVMAVPGPITSTLSQGTNNLIKQGALAVTAAEDIIFAIGLEPRMVVPEDLTADTPAQLVILNLLCGGVSEGSMLQMSSKLEPSLYMQSMTLLELSGRVRSKGADRWAFIR